MLYYKYNSSGRATPPQPCVKPWSPGRANGYLVGGQRTRWRWNPEVQRLFNRIFFKFIAEWMLRVIYSIRTSSNAWRTWSPHQISITIKTLLSTSYILRKTCYNSWNFWNHPIPCLPSPFPLSGIPQKNHLGIEILSGGLVWVTLPAYIKVTQNFWVTVPQFPWSPYFAVPEFASRSVLQLGYSHSSTSLCVKHFITAFFLASAPQ